MHPLTRTAAVALAAIAALAAISAETSASPMLLPIAAGSAKDDYSTSDGTGSDIEITIDILPLPPVPQSRILVAAPVPPPPYYAREQPAEWPSKQSTLARLGEAELAEPEADSEFDSYFEDDSAFESEYSSDWSESAEDESGWDSPKDTLAAGAPPTLQCSPWMRLPSFVSFPPWVVEWLQARSWPFPCPVPRPVSTTVIIGQVEASSGNIPESAQAQQAAERPASAAGFHWPNCTWTFAAIAAACSILVIAAIGGVVYFRRRRQKVSGDYTYISAFDEGSFDDGSFGDVKGPIAV